MPDSGGAGKRASSPGRGVMIVDRTAGARKGQNFLPPRVILAKQAHDRLCPRAIQGNVDFSRDSGRGRAAVPALEVQSGSGFPWRWGFAWSLWPWRARAANL